MPRSKVVAKPAETSDRMPGGSTSALEKIACLLGVLATKDLEQIVDRVMLLRRAGFTVREVASMLGITENHVMVATHHGKKKSGAKGAKKRGQTAHAED